MKTMTDKLALLISAWVVFAGSYVFYMHPERRWQCALGVAVTGIAWLIRSVFRGKTKAGEESRHKITQSIAYAGLLLSVGLCEALGWIAASGEFRVRACQCLAGAFVMVIGNAIPKKAITSPRRAALLRANGKAMVLAGLGYALAWLCLPLAYAEDVALSILLLTFASRVVLCLIRSDRSIPPTGPA
ncbi:hypothetical protein [Duganella levis]|uniref:Uncharacterized protein n=1 Tax=Duganella levis TaxID=2692169 RepID=A0ABW9W429_9BURK|nr:hypothetical protein [Duganella levis]MYN28684.1 hypothetical protein [Duganella levis]